jgi:negative regulator of sigma E activity
MNSISSEQLSALVDDELGSAELELVLHRLTRDADVLCRWQRYHLANEALRNGLPRHIDTSLADKVRQRVAAEPEYTAAASTGGWGKPILGMAVAASLLVVFVTGSFLLGQRSENSEMLTAAEPEVPVRLVSVQSGDNASAAVRERWQPETARRIYPYMANYGRLATSGTFPTVLPYVRMIGYEAVK